ncbi:MAG TPA: hypothetical protein VGO91_18055 [Pyrinomonadaceae bacterium]|jgi:hypothetical protein|nr:hypothetical protein [Pyrinomonadaceae bacterium]
MMRAAILLLIMMSSMLLCAAQTKQTIVEVVEPPPPPANDYFPQRWKEFTSVEGGFKILFPGTPQQTSETLAIPSGQHLTFHRLIYKSFIYYRAAYADYPRPIDNPETVKKFFDTVRDGTLAALVQLNPHILSEADFSLDGHPGRIIEMELSGNLIVRMKWIAVKERIYYVSVHTPKGQENAFEGKNGYEKIAVSFLDSFKLTNH